MDQTFLFQTQHPGDNTFLMTAARIVSLIYFHPLARDGSKILQSLSGSQRAAVVNRLADLLIQRKTEILAANQQDIQEAFASGILFTAPSFCLPSCNI